MSLPAGTQLGPYQIVSSLGAGGMGQVYRAKDTRLGRELAIKVLPPESVGNADRRWRFENEARAASALNHPNLLHIYDIGSDGGVFYIAMELVDGVTLRKLMEGGPMPPRKLLDVAIPVAEALAKAHSANIVHRDLKPENIMVSNDGFVKVLDFGLAKLTDHVASSPDAPTQQLHHTESGALLGTVGYMSPEQASGLRAESPSDQFSFGTILYEMVTGKRPFVRSTAAQTLAAIIEDEPEPVTASAPQTPILLRRVIERCLAKDPQERYAATADLARDLRDVREYGLRISDASGVRPPAAPRRPRWRRIAAALALVIAAAAIASFIAVSAGRKPLVTFDRLSYRRGTIWNARFAPDGETVIYGAAWAGKPFEIFSARVGAPEARALGITDADVLAVSPGGDLAVSQSARFPQTFAMRGTLALAPLGGGTPRPLLEGVQCADWSPDGKSLAIVHDVKGRNTLEYPQGRMLYQSSGWIGNVRIAPDGKHIAFAEHPVDPDPSGMISVVDLQGRRSILSSNWSDVEGLAWTPSGREVWFSGSRGGTVTHALNAVTLEGKERVVADFPADIRIEDIDRAGRLLFVREEVFFHINASPRGAERELDVSIFDNSVARDISPDGTTLLILAANEGGVNRAVYTRSIDGSNNGVRMGDGLPNEFAADGTWAAAVLPIPEPAQLVRIPTGIGAPAPLTHDALNHSWVNIFPDCKRILFLGSEAGHGSRLYVQDVAGGAARPVSPEGARIQWHAISPDGTRIAALSPEHRITLYSPDGAPPIVTPLAADDEPIRWTADGRGLYVYRRSEVPARVYRADLATGAKTLWRSLMPADSAGLQSIVRVQLTPDEKAYAYSSVVRLSTLYLAHGLR